MSIIPIATSMPTAPGSPAPTPEQLDTPEPGGGPRAASLAGAWRRFLCAGPPAWR